MDLQFLSIKTATMQKKNNCIERFKILCGYRFENKFCWTTKKIILNIKKFLN